MILGSAELLCDELESGQRPHLLAEMIATAAQRGADLTSRLLAFGRKQPLQPRLLELGSLVAGMEAMLRRTLGENIEIRVIRPAPGRPRSIRRCWQQRSSTWQSMPVTQ